MMVIEIGVSKVFKIRVQPTWYMLDKLNQALKHWKSFNKMINIIHLHSTWRQLHWPIVCKLQKKLDVKFISVHSDWETRMSAQMYVDMTTINIQLQSIGKTHSQMQKIGQWKDIFLEFSVFMHILPIVPTWFQMQTTKKYSFICWCLQVFRK